MTHQEIRKKFKDFFEARKHKWVESSSLLPDDQSVLFTTAGMQQFKPYYTGQVDAMNDFGSLNTASIQKSIRTSCIDEVGDDTHLTFFEMLGNFSFGGYWKKDAIEWAHEFITKEMGLKIDYVSVFEGLPSAGILADEESVKIWKSVDPNLKIRKKGIDDNFWGPTGNKGPCGPSTEIYVSGTEIWNIVFNEFYYPGSLEELKSGKSDKKLEKLQTRGIDTGMGLERLAMVVQNKKNIFETDLFESIIKLTPSELDPVRSRARAKGASPAEFLDRLKHGQETTPRKDRGAATSNGVVDIKTKRIIADHSRAISFLIADGVHPSNKEQGYILRRLMRRVITYFYVSKSDSTVMHDIFAKIIENYGQYYPELNADLIIHQFDKEKEKFGKTLSQGLKELEKMPSVNAENAFKLYESFGLPFEIIKELGKEKTSELSRESFDEEFKKHQEISRAGAEKKFGGHGLLLNTGELKVGNEEELKKATRLHTATHLLHASLRKILGDDVKQQGSDITPERLRFDFTFSRKLTSEELKQVEDMVNDAVKNELPVTKTEMSYENAVKSGALAFFKQKYPDHVTVYTIGPEPLGAESQDEVPVEGQDSSTRTSSEPQPNSSKSSFSRELCGGPHVSNTREIGKFKIVKEESVSAGVRRIRAVIE